MNENKNGQSGSFSGQPEPVLWDYLYIILRGKWIILLCLVVVLASTAYYTYKKEPMYAATATVLVGAGGQQKAFSFFDPAGTSAGKNMKNEIEILRSRTMAEAVARALLQKQYLDDEKKETIWIIQAFVDGKPQGRLVSESEIASRIPGVVSFDPMESSDILKITARSTDPRDAALIANTVAEIYKDRNVQTSRMRSRSVREFLQSQLQAKQETLAQAEDSLQTYMERTGLISLDQEASRIVSQLSKFEAERDGGDIELKSLATTLQLYKDQLATQEPALARSIGNAVDPYIRLLQSQIAQWEVQKDVTVAQNPNVVGQQIYIDKLKEIDAQIAALRSKLKQRTDEYLRSVLPGQGSDAASYVSQMKAQIISNQIQQQSLLAKKEALAKYIAEYEREFERIPEKSMQLARLQRVRLSNEKLYLLVQDKFNESAISEQSEFGYVDIIDAAVAPGAPVSPNMNQNLMLGAIIGLALGIAVTFLREYLDVRIRTPEDLKRHGLQMSTAVALMDSELKNLGAKGIVPFDGKQIDAHMLTLTNPLTPVAESFRRLRTSIQYARLDKPLRSLVVTSPNPSEGRSTVVANLAVAFAQAGKRVLLLDTDLRKPALHSEFGLNREPGLCDYLFGESTQEEVLQKRIIENLDIIAAGKIPPNPSEILGSEKVRHFLETMKESYDIVLLDSPPLLAVTDASILSTLVDGVVVVVSSGSTRIETLQQSLEALQNVGSKLVGIVLNRFDFKKAYGGYHGYHSAYGYQHYAYGSGGNGESGKRKKVRSKT